MSSLIMLAVALAASLAPMSIGGHGRATDGGPCCAFTETGTETAVEERVICGRARTLGGRYGASPARCVDRRACESVASGF